jgi:uncharacterized membrane protein YdjX (TVP38/TMEM64 family)
MNRNALPGGRPKQWGLIAALGVAVVLAVTCLLSRYDFVHVNTDTLADRVRASGAVGPLALMALLIVQAVIAPLPSPPILMAAGFVYGPWIGFVIGWVGLLLGASACFGLARVCGRPFAQRFVRREHLTTVDTRVAARSGVTLLAIVSLRVFMPPLFDAVSYGCGLVRVPFPVFAVATALGEIPKVGSFTYIGSAAGGVSSWLTAWVLLGPAIGVLGVQVIRSRLARRAAQTQAPSQEVGAPHIPCLHQGGAKGERHLHGS